MYKELQIFSSVGYGADQNQSVFSWCAFPCVFRRRGECSAVLGSRLRRATAVGEASPLGDTRRGSHRLIKSPGAPNPPYTITESWLTPNIFVIL
jgi:hypothetical protein